MVPITNWYATNSNSVAEKHIVVICRKHATLTTLMTPKQKYLRGRKGHEGRIKSVNNNYNVRVRV